MRSARSTGIERLPAFRTDCRTASMDSSRESMSSVNVENREIVGLGLLSLVRRGSWRIRRLCCRPAQTTRMGHPCLPS